MVTRAKLLVVELWGIGDLVMASGFLRAAAERFDVTILAKPHAEPLLRPQFPQVEFIPFDAPWTVFTGKYRLWRWPWARLGGLARQLRRGGLDLAVSARLRDPRDHLLMRLAGIPRRLGFAHPRFGALLNEALPHSAAPRHVVEDWQALGTACGLGGSLVPALEPARYPRPAGWPETGPIVCLHAGARIPVRRWSEAKFAEVLRRVRALGPCQVVLIPDPDGYGLGLAPLADRVIEKMSLPELVAALGASDLLICNDSAPGHIAAACGTPVVTYFGPTSAERYRPWGEAVQVVIRDLCPLRPCFDYCQFAEPHCLTRLEVDETWPEVARFLRGRLPQSGS